MIFPVSGVEVFPLIPPSVAFVLAFFTSMGGLSGAFALLPFQVSVLGFTSPAVSATNSFYNVVAIPGGVYRYIREARMAWPLAAVITLGTLPGIFLGIIVRIVYLPDPGAFKMFVGCVLLYIGARILYDLTPRAARQRKVQKNLEAEFTRRREGLKGASGPDGRVRTMRVKLLSVEYAFYGESFAFNPLTICGLSALVGVIAGSYGIGGGALMAPFLVSIFRLPVYTIAGATLLSTFLSSLAAVCFYAFVAPFYAETGLAVSPDWLLGFFFGIGGLAGTYLGARCQRFVPEKIIKLILAGALLFIAVRYIAGFFA